MTNVVLWKAVSPNLSLKATVNIKTYRTRKDYIYSVELGEGNENLKEISAKLNVEIY